MVAVYVTDGEQALTQVEAQGFDLILMDVDLPGISGLEVLQRMRQNHPSIPAAILSSDFAGELKGIQEELNLAGFLNKPLDKNALVAMLERSLGAAAKN